jgi:hypothetical protein
MSILTYKMLNLIENRQYYGVPKYQRHFMLLNLPNLPISRHKKECLGKFKFSLNMYVD